MVLREGERRRWGGDLRRRFLLDGVAERRHARIVDDWKPGSIDHALVGLLVEQRRTVVRPRRLWVRRPLVASTELLDELHLAPVLRHGRPWVVDFHDEPLLQADALGIQLTPQVRASLVERRERNLEAFRWVTAPSAPFARLSRLPMDRVVVAGNGTNTATVQPAPMPTTPGVAFVSGAAPSRGIEELIEAVRLVRSEVPGTRLLLYLAATSEASGVYLAELTARHAGDDWIEIGQVPYGALGEALGRATLLAIPTPANPYWDSVPPLKLFDGMAAARPHVVTPRPETARILREHGAGVVAGGDDAAAMAAAMAPLLCDPAAAERMGANARAAAERHYDWRVIGARLAEELDSLSSPWARIARRRPRSS